jgi:hypothetical protein
MPKHEDDDPVMVGHSSGRYHGARSQEPEELGYTWGDWRAFTEAEQLGALNEYRAGLMDVWIEDEN